MTEREVKTSLWFLIVAAFSSAGLFCFFILDRDSGFAGLALGLVVLIGVPSTLLFGIDASRAIRRQKRTNHLMNNVGRVLGIPQSVFGVILMAFGVAYPVYHFMNGLGPSPLFGLAYIALALVMFSVGCHYFKEGLSLMGVWRERKSR